MRGSAELRRVAVAADSGRRGGSRRRRRQGEVGRPGERLGWRRVSRGRQTGIAAMSCLILRAEMRNQVVASGVALSCRLGRGRGDANRTDRTGRYGRNGSNRSAGGEVAKGIYEKQPVGLCDTYVRSCPLAVASPILYQMGSRAGRRRESLESIAEARIDNVSIETEISNRKRYEQ